MSPAQTQMSAGGISISAVISACVTCMSLMIHAFMAVTFRDVGKEAQDAAHRWPQKSAKLQAEVAMRGSASSLAAIFAT